MAPCSTNGAMASARTSCTTSPPGQPTRRVAIGAPICPSPMNPTTGGDAVTAGATTSTTTALAVTTEHATGRSVRALLLDVGLGDDLGGKVQPLAEVVKTLGGEGVVVPLPRELGLEVAAGSQGLASLDDLWENCQTCANWTWILRLKRT